MGKRERFIISCLIIRLKCECGSEIERILDIACSRYRFIYSGFLFVVVSREGDDNYVVFGS